MKVENCMLEVMNKEITAPLSEVEMKYEIVEACLKHIFVDLAQRLCYLVSFSRR